MSYKFPICTTKNVPIFLKSQCGSADFDPWHNTEDVPAELPPGIFGKPQFLNNIGIITCRDGAGIIINTSYSKLISRGIMQWLFRY